VSRAKTAEPIEVPFGMPSWVGQRKHVLDAVTLAKPDEYDWAVRVRRRLGLFVKLL